MTETAPPAEPLDAAALDPSADRAAPTPLDVARRVLACEAAALTALSEILDAEFDRAVALIAGRSGRVIVTGMGKSGHIGRKIAATLASTGTPAHFVHPAEASHGDLGMIAAGDVVLALSHSGETSELSDIVAYCRRYDIPVLAITARADSSLARRARVALLLPAAEEACPMGLAPTSSTTMSLALGDALAVALFERRGFSVEEFTLFHPGGALGRTLLRVDEIMQGRDALPLIVPATPMRAALAAISAGGLGCAGVVDEAGALVGIITDGDLRRHFGLEIDGTTAADIMTPNPRVIARDALAQAAAREMNVHGITALFVVEAGRPLGLVHIHDCLRAGVG